MVEQWSSKSHAWVRFLLSLLKKTAYSAYKTTRIVKKTTNFYNLNKFQIFKKFKFFKNIFNSANPAKFLFKKHRTAFKGFFFFTPSVYRFLFLNFITVNKTTAICLNNTSDFVFLNHTNSYQTLAIYNFFQFFTKFVNSRNGFLSTQNCLRFLKFNYINHFLLLAHPDAFITKKAKTLLPLKISSLRWSSRYRSETLPTVSSRKASRSTQSQKLNIKKNSLFAKFFFYKNNILTLKFWSRSKSALGAHVGDYLNTVNLNKLETFSNPEPLTLLYLSKMFFMAEQVLRAPRSKFKFILYQVTERDYTYDNLINITRYSKNLADFEFFLFWSNYKISKTVDNKIHKLLNFSAEPSLTDKLLRFENLNNSFAKNALFGEFFSETSNVFNCHLWPTRNGHVDSFLSVTTLTPFPFCSPSPFKNLAATSFFKILIFFSSPVYLKYLINRTDAIGADSCFYLKNPSSALIFKEVIGNFVTKHFMNSKYFINSTNLIPNSDFFFLLKKKILKTFDYQKFNTNITPWYSNSLTRFIESISGKKALIKLYAFLNNYLSFYEKSHCLLWAQKLKNFRKILGPRLYLAESLEIIYLSLKLKDSFFLLNWMISIMQKISFWKYKLFFRYLRYVFRYFFSLVFEELGIRGLKFQLKGKISVAGNARTRTVLQKIGQVSHSKFDNKISYELGLIRTFTGVLGLKVWIFF